MKNISIAITLTIFIIACGAKKVIDPVVVVVVPPTPVVEVPKWELPEPAACGYQYTADDAKGWSLVFDENFDKDLEKWTIWRGGAYNNELQNYKAENLILKNGHLYIHAKQEFSSGSTNPQDGTNKNFEYTSGRIETKELYTATNNNSIKMVARIQQPLGEGNWSAFWSYGDPWPTKGEIDIMEYRGGAPNKFQSVYHYGRNTNQLQTNADINNFYYQTPAGQKDLASCFYVYELEWSKGRLDIKLDGKLLKSFTEEKNAFISEFIDKPEKVVLNLAIGGGFFQNLDKSKIPANSAMIVDWVKVYKK